MFEYAASFPREAEASLESVQAHVMSLFSLFDKRRTAARDGIEIESQAQGEGYDWEISISPETLQLIRERAVEVF
jgi:hypothetical protein